MLQYFFDSGFIYNTMTINYAKTYKKNFLRKANNFSLIEKYEINTLNMPVISNSGLDLSIGEKTLIIEKLLEAHELAVANVKAGNITTRGFATNVCTTDGYWSIGTNFNNTRNDISSVCGERSAILASYNSALLRYQKTGGEFNFKIKYLCMAQSDDIYKTVKPAVPCEDCLSWLNTNKYFDENTTIYSFTTNENGSLSLKATKPDDLLPCKNQILTREFSKDKHFKYSSNAMKSMEMYGISENDILHILEINQKLSEENPFVKISNQNIACSVVANEKLYSAVKVDWTKRWFVEPLEIASYKALEDNREYTRITAVSYLGDYCFKNGDEYFEDSPVSIKSLGRIRQKYATNSTLLILNLENHILVTTIGEYLPKKFEQGYKIL